MGDRSRYINQPIKTAGARNEGLGVFLSELENNTTKNENKMSIAQSYSKLVQGSNPNRGASATQSLTFTSPNTRFLVGSDLGSQEISSAINSIAVLNSKFVDFETDIENISTRSTNASILVENMSSVVDTINTSFGTIYPYINWLSTIDVSNPQPDVLDIIATINISGDMNVSNNMSVVGTANISFVIASNISSENISTDTLVVHGDTRIGGTANISFINASNISSENISTDKLLVHGDTRIGGTANISFINASNISSENISTVKLVVHGDTRIGGTANISFINASNISSENISTVKLLVHGDTRIGGTANITNVSALNISAENISTNTLVVHGDTRIGGTANISFINASNISSENISTDKIIVHGYTRIGGTASIRNINASNISSENISTYTLLVHGDTRIDGTASITNINASNISSENISTVKLLVHGDAEIIGTASITNVSAFNISSENISTNALVVHGDTRIDGTASITNVSAFNISAENISTDTLVVHGDAEIIGTASITNLSCDLTSNLIAGNGIAITTVNGKPTISTSENTDYTNINVSNISSENISTDKLVVHGTATITNVSTSELSTEVITIKGERNMQGNLHFSSYNDSLELYSSGDFIIRDFVYSDDRTYDYYPPRMVDDDDVIRVGTNTYTATSSMDSGDSWKAFSRTASYSVTTPTTTPSDALYPYIQFHSTTAIHPKSLLLVANDVYYHHMKNDGSTAVNASDDNVNKLPSSWKLEGSNDESVWDMLIDYSNEGFNSGDYTGTLNNRGRGDAPGYYPIYQFDVINSNPKNAVLASNSAAISYPITTSEYNYYTYFRMSMTGPPVDGSSGYKVRFGVYGSLDTIDDNVGYFIRCGEGNSTIIPELFSTNTSIQNLYASNVSAFNISSENISTDTLLVHGDTRIDGTANISFINASNISSENISAVKLVVHGDTRIGGTANISFINASNISSENISTDKLLVHGDTRIGGTANISSINASNISSENISTDALVVYGDTRISGTANISFINASNISTENISTDTLVVHGDTRISGTANISFINASNISTENISTDTLVVHGDTRISGTANISFINASNISSENISTDKLVVHGDTRISGTASIRNINASNISSENISTDTLVVHGDTRIGGTANISFINTSELNTQTITVGYDEFSIRSDTDIRSYDYYPPIIDDDDGISGYTLSSTGETNEHKHFNRKPRVLTLIPVGDGTFVQFQSSVPIHPSRFLLLSKDALGFADTAATDADDIFNQFPPKWKLEGSSDGGTWDTLVDNSGGSDESDYLTKFTKSSISGTYTLYRNANSDVIDLTDDGSGGCEYEITLNGTTGGTPILINKYYTYFKFEIVGDDPPLGMTSGDGVDHKIGGFAVYGTTDKYINPDFITCDPETGTTIPDLFSTNTSIQELVVVNVSASNISSENISTNTLLVRDDAEIIGTASITNVSASNISSENMSTGKLLVRDDAEIIGTASITNVSALNISSENISTDTLVVHGDTRIGGTASITNLSCDLTSNLIAGSGIAITTVNGKPTISTSGTTVITNINVSVSNISSEKISTNTLVVNGDATIDGTANIITNISTIAVKTSRITFLSSLAGRAAKGYLYTYDDSMQLRTGNIRFMNRDKADSGTTYDYMKFTQNTGVVRINKLDAGPTIIENMTVTGDVEIDGTASITNVSALNISAENISTDTLLVHGDTRINGTANISFINASSIRYSPAITLLRVANPPSTVPGYDYLPPVYFDTPYEVSYPTINYSTSTPVGTIFTAMKDGYYRITCMLVLGNSGTGDGYKRTIGYYLDTSSSGFAGNYNYVYSSTCYFDGDACNTGVCVGTFIVPFNASDTFLIKYRVIQGEVSYLANIVYLAGSYISIEYVG